MSLTFDDALTSQVRLAVPILEEAGLRGTFYINPRGDAWTGPGGPWPAVAASGHELGNHTVSHPCGQNFAFVAAGAGLEYWTVERIAADIDLAEARLRELSGAVPRSFAYPCYQDSVGRGASRQSYIPVVAERFVAGRGRGEVANDAERCDLHHCWSWPAERLSAAELIGLCEQAATEGRWGVLTFHGVDEGHLPVASGDLRALCAHLQHHRERIWTAPVATVAQAIGAWRAAASA